MIVRPVAVPSRATLFGIRCGAARVGAIDVSARGVRGVAVDLAERGPPDGESQAHVEVDHDRGRNAVHAVTAVAVELAGRCRSLVVAVVARSRASWRSRVIASSLGPAAPLMGALAAARERAVDAVLDH